VPFQKILILYIIMVVIFLIIDFIWLGAIAKGLYQKHLGPLLRAKPNWIAAVVFYLIFVAGILLFVVMPAVSLKSLSHALIFGCLFGLVTYATYDLTNLATLRDWPILMTFVDLIWGAALCTAVSGSGYLVYFKFL
jgi:uncharacterized membrane protein